MALSWESFPCDGALGARTLRTLLKSAHYELDLDRDPYGRTREVSSGPDARKDFEPEELGAILRWFEEHAPRWYPMLVTLTFTGCRFGEIAALTYGDLDLKRHEIVISKSAWQGIVTTPKTGRSRRVPLLPPVAAVLGDPRDHREDELVFPSRTGGYHVPGGFGPFLHKAIDALGLPKRRGAAHRLRHSANNLLRQVASAEVTRAITGHSSSELTWHYSHVGNEEKSQAMQQVWKMVVGDDGIVGDRVGDGDPDAEVIPLFPRND